jgi:hypothetical protein
MASLHCLTQHLQLEMRMIIKHFFLHLVNFFVPIWSFSELNNYFSTDHNPTFFIMKKNREITIVLTSRAAIKNILSSLMKIYSQLH